MRFESSWMPGGPVLGAAIGLLWLASSHSAAADLEDVIARVTPSVMAIGTYQKTRSPQFAFRGTGFAIGDGTLVATNAHVLPDALQSDEPESIAVVAPAAPDAEPQRREARAVAIDKDHDLAILRISGPALPALAFPAADRVREGRSAAFTGFPIGAVLGLIPVTHRATVSAITPIALPSANARQLDTRVFRRLKSGSFRVLQLDATAYPGSSGSPLYDAATGELLGIVNLVFVKETKEALLAQPSGISFAVPAEHLRELLRSVKD